MKTLYEMSDKQLLNEFVRFLKQDDDNFPDKEMRESFEQNILYRMDSKTCYNLISKITENSDNVPTVEIHTQKGTKIYEGPGLLVPFKYCWMYYQNYRYDGKSHLKISLK